MPIVLTDNTRTTSSANKVIDGSNHNLESTCDSNAQQTELPTHVNINLTKCPEQQQS